MTWTELPYTKSTGILLSLCFLAICPQNVKIELETLMIQSSLFFRVGLASAKGNSRWVNDCFPCLLGFSLSSLSSFPLEQRKCVGRLFLALLFRINILPVTSSLAVTSRTNNVSHLHRLLLPLPSKDLIKGSYAEKSKCYRRAFTWPPHRCIRWKCRIDWLEKPSAFLSKVKPRQQQ